MDPEKTSQAVCGLISPWNPQCFADPRFQLLPGSGVHRSTGLLRLGLSTSQPPGYRHGSCLLNPAPKVWDKPYLYELLWFDWGTLNFCPVNWRFDTIKREPNATMPTNTGDGLYGLRGYGYVPAEAFLNLKILKWVPPLFAMTKQSIASCSQHIDPRSLQRDLVKILERSQKRKRHSRTLYIPCHPIKHS